MSEASMYELLSDEDISQQAKKARLGLSSFLDVTDYVGNGGVGRWTHALGLGSTCALRLDREQYIQPSRY